MFKVGDRVKYIESTHDFSCGKIFFGGEYVVKRVFSNPHGSGTIFLYLKGLGEFSFNGKSFLKLENSPVVDYNKQTEPNAAVPHKHSALIKAWADGALIELRWTNGQWINNTHPIWAAESTYRIKPVPKPDVVRKAFAGLDMNTQVYGHPALSLYNSSGGNVSLTFDGETGKLKGVELC